MQSFNDHFVNKGIIVWHITAYFFIMIANFSQSFVAFKGAELYEITTYCYLAINLMCNIILALIVN